MSRRGAAAIELALAVGVIALMLGAVLDYGLYMRDLSYASLAVREAARVGAQTAMSAGPEEAAEARLADVLAEMGFADRPRTADARLLGASPDVGIAVSLDLAYTPIVGLVAVPDAARATITMRMQGQ
ncbi:MAG: TadE/TadG family type IV pilus assembly protein [Myxococcota bacterium]